MKSVLVDLPLKPKSIVTFIAMCSGQEASTVAVLDNLKYLCQEQLHQYLQPTHLYVLENEEHSKMNEADYQALALSLFSQRVTIRPQTETEQAIHELWSQLLNVAPELLSTDDNFFDLGGDSLKAGLLVSTMRKMLGASISVADLLGSPTIGKSRLFSVVV